MVLSLLVACGEAPVPSEPEASSQPEVGELRLFVVLDTVRADHLSACGYERPTSPVLEALVQRGAALSCDAVAPGAWTMPSHASFFTGLGPTEHCAHMVPPGGATVLNLKPVRPLGDEVTTLAETLSGLGWGTVAVSANPVVSAPIGLLQGFRHTHTATEFRDLDTDVLLAKVQELVAEVPAEQDLFLFVNLSEAHAPWVSVPEGHPWLPPRQMKHPGVQELMGGDPTPEAFSASIAENVDLYDRGIERADHTLGALLGWLQGTGRLVDGSRVVVTSDHGEFLGEHGLVGHGHYLWQPNQEVFVLDWLVGGQTTLPEGPFNAQIVHQLLGGDSELLPVEAMAYPDAHWEKLTGGRFGVHTTAAVWGERKVVWQDGETVAYTLADDPGELSGQPPTADEQARIDELVERVRASAERPTELSEEALEALRAAGYVE